MYGRVGAGIERFPMSCVCIEKNPAEGALDDRCLLGTRTRDPYHSAHGLRAPIRTCTFTQATHIHKTPSSLQKTSQTASRASSLLAGSGAKNHTPLAEVFYSTFSANIDTNLLATDIPEFGDLTLRLGTTLEHRAASNLSTLTSFGYTNPMGRLISSNRRHLPITCASGRQQHTNFTAGLS